LKENVIQESYSPTYLSNIGVKPDEAKIEEIKRKLAELYTVVYKPEKSPPKYYAILIMDAMESATNYAAKACQK
jgi:hypothetical protein